MQPSKKTTVETCWRVSLDRNKAQLTLLFVYQCWKKKKKRKMCRVAKKRVSGLKRNVVICRRLVFLVPVVGHKALMISLNLDLSLAMCCASPLSDSSPSAALSQFAARLFWDGLVCVYQVESISKLSWVLGYMVLVHSEDMPKPV